MKNLQKQIEIANQEITRLGLENEVWSLNVTRYSISLYADFCYSIIVKLHNEGYCLIRQDDTSKIATYKNTEINIEFVVCQK
jgi:hypothetical protein